MKYLLFILLFGVNFLYAQKVKVNNLAPDFEIKTQLGQQQNVTKLSELKGKFVLLDFWATWCKPCVKTMPYLEKVKEQFGDTLVVVSISDETVEEVSMFLKGKANSSTFLIDQGSKITNLYDVGAIPHSVLIGADGKVKLIGSPLNITPNVIRQVMNDQVVEIVKVVPAEKTDELIGKTNKGIKCSVEITPYNPQKPSTFRNVTDGEYANRRLYFSNMTIKSIYEHLYHMPNRGILRVPSLEKYTDGAEASNLFCVDIIIRPEDVSKKFQVAVQELHRRFSLKSKMEYLTLTAKVLEVDNPLNLPQKAPYNASDRSASTFDQLTSSISSFNTFGMPVVNETNLTDRYMISFETLPDNPDQLMAVLRSKGLKITEKVVQLPTLILYE